MAATLSTIRTRCVNPLCLPSMRTYQAVGICGAHTQAPRARMAKARLGECKVEAVAGVGFVCTSHDRPISAAQLAGETA